MEAIADPRNGAVTFDYAQEKAIFERTFAVLCPSGKRA
jgi:hypothetical protein